MGGHRPNYFSNAFKTPELQGLQYNTSVAGTVIQVVFGTNRLGSNLLQYQNFRTNSPGKKGGGKGGGGGKKGNKQKYYSIDLAVGICQGPASFVGSVLNGGGDNLIWANGGVQQGGLGAIPLNGYNGTDGQAPDPVLSTDGFNIPAIGYSGLCYVTATPLTLQDSPTLPDIDFEICGFERGTVGSNFGNDANPANIIIRLLTDSRWGAGFPIANIDVTGWGNNTGSSNGDISGGTGSFNSYALFCTASQLAMSLVLDRQQPASQWLEEIAQVTSAAICWSGTKLRIVPYASVAISGQGVTFNPSLLPIFTLTDDDLLLPGAGSLDETINENPDDPITVTRKDPAQIANWLSIEYRNGVNAYNIDVVATWDQGLIDATMLRTQPASTEHGFTNQTSALASANVQLLNQTLIRADPIKFTLGVRHSLLDLMDVIAINDSTLGWVNKLVWVTAIEENDNGDLDVTCREIASNSGQPLIVTERQNTAGSGPNVFAVPPNVNTPFITEPTAELLSAYGYSSPTIIIGLSGGPNGSYSPNWGGAQIMISTDNSTYGYLATWSGATPQGVLMNDLPAFSGSNPDNTDTLTVDLSESNGELTSVSSSASAAGTSLCAIMDPQGNVEYLSFTTATLINTNQYQLTGLYRGLYGTTATDKPAGSQFMYMGSNQFFQATLASQYVGKELYLKFLSFNTYGQEIQDIADVNPYTYVPQGYSPLPNIFSRAVINRISVPVENLGTTAIKRVAPANVRVIHQLRANARVVIDTAGI